MTAGVSVLRDPLGARPETLIADALDAATEIEAARAVWPALTAVGMDPQRTADELRDLAGRARAAAMWADQAVSDAARPHLAAVPVLEQVRAWQRQVRRLLDCRAPAGAAAELAASDLRAALRPTAHRMAGAITMLRAAVELLSSLAAELGPTIAAAWPEGRDLLDRLEALSRQDYDARLVRRERTAEARDLVEQLRRRMREARREIGLARVSGAELLPVMSLQRARADVARRSPVRRKQAE